MLYSDIAPNNHRSRKVALTSLIARSLKENVQFETKETLIYQCCFTEPIGKVAVVQNVYAVDGRIRRAVCFSFPLIFLVRPLCPAHLALSSHNALPRPAGPESKCAPSPVQGNF